MSDVGDVRVVQYFQKCPNDIEVICSKQQVLKRSWGVTIITLGIGAALDWDKYWDDIPGTAQCPPCPTGEEPKDKNYRFCCFKTALVRIWSKASAPGPIAEVVGRPLSFFEYLRETPTMTVPVLAYVRTECMVLNGEEANLVLEAMEKALEMMQATALYSNLIQDQKDAIQCLKSKMHILGW